MRPVLVCVVMLVSIDEGAITFQYGANALGRDAFWRCRNTCVKFNILMCEISGSLIVRVDGDRSHVHKISV